MCKILPTTHAFYMMSIFMLSVWQSLFHYMKQNLSTKKPIDLIVAFLGLPDEDV